MPETSILLVDDEEVIRKSFARELQMEHFAVTAVASGSEAITALENGQFDLVITDLMMPGIDGLGVLKAAKAVAPLTNVIILTGYGDMESAIDALRLGADDFVRKPCEVEELVFRIQHCLEKRNLLLERARSVKALQCADEEKKTLQAQLIHAQKMEAIGTLAGGIAHDFNNLLSLILGYAEMARFASPPESMVAQKLDKVLEAGHRSVALVQQILAFSRRMDTERMPLNPVHIVKEAIKLLRPSLPSTIAIKQQIDTADRQILADPTQVHQILMNLCTNAFHAMEQTGGTLEITLKDCELSQNDLQQYPEVHPGRFVVLSISDTGTGIDPEIWDRIFDPYFTTKEVGKGTGMGLAIVHGIITSYGGFITNENLENGTVFHVYFPAIEQELVPEVRPVETAPSGTGHILLIDDEEALVELCKAMLEQLGYEVTVRTNSLEALAIFLDQSNRFDAVITDQTMPGMTGINLAKRMLEIRPDIPIILCTGYSTLVSEEQAKAVGIREFASKPLTKTKIATLLKKVLDRDSDDPNMG